jgi:hypothetical protein
MLVISGRACYDCNWFVWIRKRIEGIDMKEKQNTAAYNAGFAAGYEPIKGAAGAIVSGRSAFQVNKGLVVVANNPAEIRRVLGRKAKIRRLDSCPSGAISIEGLLS